MRAGGGRGLGLMSACGGGGSLVGGGDAVHCENLSRSGVGEEGFHRPSGDLILDGEG